MRYTLLFATFFAFSLATSLVAQEPTSPPTVASNSASPPTVASTSVSADSAALSDSGPKVRLTVFPGEIVKSPVYSYMLDLIARGEKDQKAALQHFIDRYQKITAVNLKEDILRIDASLTDPLRLWIEDSETELLRHCQMTVELRQVGNLPGIILSYPKHVQDQSYASGILSTMQIDEDPELLVWQSADGGGKIPKSGPTRFVFSYNKKILTDAIMSKQVDLPTGQVPAGASTLAALQIKRPDKGWLWSLIANHEEEYSTSHGIKLVYRILARLKSIDIVVTHSPADNTVHTTLRLHTGYELAADQIKLMIAAYIEQLTADLEFAETPEPFRSLPDQMTIESDGNSVIWSFSSADMSHYEALLGLFAEVLKM